MPPPEGPIPAHVAIIMDGNGRWAQARGLPRLSGHHEGAKAVRRIVTYAREIGIRYLTLYAFSSENWKRPSPEVRGLMMLLQDFLRVELETMLKNGVRLNVIGTPEKLPDYVLGPLQEAQAKTASCTGMTLTLALSYGSRDELVRAVRRVAHDVKTGKIDPDAIDSSLFERHLDTAGMPDPDLLIRTSGENRVSNFLLWQIAYSELFILPMAWPDFDEKALADTIDSFHRRERRFGMTGEQAKEAKGTDSRP